MRAAAVWFPAAPALDEALWAMEDITPHVEVTRSDLLIFDAKGPARYLGSEQAVVEKTEEVLSEIDGTSGVRVGIADGAFAAEFAAYQRLIVEPGATSEFLGSLPLAALDRPELSELLVRLGIRTLGAFAALPAMDVLNRFGSDGARAHRLASGLDDRLLNPVPTPPDLEVINQIDPPIERVDSAAFVAKAMADDLHERLIHAGLTCAQILIEAHTEHGQQHVRCWRHDGALSPSDIADRVRWQLDGWLSGTSGAPKPTAGINLLRLVPDQLKRGGDNQSALWGKSGAEDARMARVLARVQGILGPESVMTAVVGGGRDPVSRVTWVTWGEPREPRLPANQPWPGCIPDPSPTTVFFDPLPAALLDHTGAAVTINRRLTISAAPSHLRINGVGRGALVRLSGWAGPWPADEHWWDPALHRRRARMQLQAEDGRAWLVAMEANSWWVDGSYE